MQPGTKRITAADRPRIRDQGKERVLKGVLDVVRLAKHAPADGKDHSSMTVDQGSERSLVVLANEPLQQLRFR
jgi:hypothetical protein